MQQIVEILKLKLLISERKIQDQIGIQKASIELFFVLAILMFSGLFVFSYMLITWVHFSYRFELIGFLFGVSLVSFALTPLLGGRLGEFLDFKALYFYPVSTRKMFLSSMLSSLLDLVMLPSYAFFWGGAIGLCVFSSFYKLPFYLIIFLLQTLFCIGLSQQLFLFYQFVLRRTHWYQFIVTFVLPVSGVMLIFYSYGTVLLQLPFVEEFSRPDYPYLSYTYLFPPSTLALCMKSVFFSNWTSFFSYSLLLLVQFSLLIVSGSLLVNKIQIGNEVNQEHTKVDSGWSIHLRACIDYLFGHKNILMELVYKDLLLFLREPYVKTMIFIPLFMSTLAWCMCYLLFSIKAPLAIMISDIVAIIPANVSGIEFGVKVFLDTLVQVLKSLPDKQWVMMIWPFYFYGAMLAIATEAGVNIFGSERQGINHLLLLPVPRWKIILSKNLSIFLVVISLSSIVTLFAFVTNIMSFHILHSLWFFFISCVFWIFIPGNFISIYFPMKIDSDLSSALQRDSFGRTLVLLICRFTFALVGMIVVIPVVAMGVLPLLDAQDSYFLPFSLQNIGLINSTFSIVSAYLFSFVVFVFYALGGYILSLLIYDKCLKRRENNILRELNRSVM
ncbi:MAG: hypothetical protein KC646_06665 [Candidatus Cloacimonetes bacterium]|nr:hypothetical protein [Candidatus Cloacimonadota bacterium]